MPETDGKEPKTAPERISKGASADSRTGGVRRLQSTCAIWIGAKAARCVTSMGLPEVASQARLFFERARMSCRPRASRLLVSRKIFRPLPIQYRVFETFSNLQSYSTGTQGGVYGVPGSL